MGLLGGIIKGVTGLIGGNKQAKATKQAAQLEFDAAMKGIAEQARQFDTTRADFAPYQQAGQAALERMTALLGMGTPESQASEIEALRGSPLYKSLYGAGEEAILANASATGGLRGGNAQRSLYELGEDTLSALIERQLGNYGGLVGVGTGASGAVGNFGANAVAQQNALRGQGAGAQAQSALIRGGIAGQNWANIGTSVNDAISNATSGGGFDWKKLLF